MTCSKTSVVVAEAVIVLRQLLQQNPDFAGSGVVVRRLSVLLLQSFLDPSDTEEKGGGRSGEHDQGGSGNGVLAAGAARASLAQPGARASIIWTLGEYHQHISSVAIDVLRVLAKAFPELEEEVKMQVGVSEKGIPGMLLLVYRSDQKHQVVSERNIDLLLLKNIRTTVSSPT